MRRLSNDELIAALRIFNRTTNIVRKTHPNYHGKKFLHDIKNYVSSNRWIMFPVANVTSREEGVNSPTPNVSMAFMNGCITDNTVGQAETTMGLVFGNNGAMQWLWQILRKPSNTNSFMELLNGLNDAWKVSIDHKIHYDFFGEAPTYETMHSYLAPTITADDIRSGITSSDNSRPTGVLNVITIFQVYKESIPESFDADVIKIFDLFFKVLSLR